MNSFRLVMSDDFSSRVQIEQSFENYPKGGRHCALRDFYRWELKLNKKKDYKHQILIIFHCF